MDPMFPSEVEHADPGGAYARLIDELRAAGVRDRPAAACAASGERLATLGCVPGETPSK